eukprot:CAMPEP_0168330024 /NCGR_PEP_ID=MMETSP0213-20121227/7464_1 /TAXON_ID=151035 /ORGANISM="Euplotes harpa, Strain FSP1.4" /LENGTH=33 /DNA_ID= /DNA_START= /DNA_END= /DNA_ORIENTATION=
MAAARVQMIFVQTCPEFSMIQIVLKISSLETSA